MSIDVRVDLAVRGVRVATPVRRPAGAGPSDDGHVVIDGTNAALPINPLSGYEARDGRVWLGDVDTVNRTVNLPCAFTDFATCPLPPAGNNLTVAIEAGERLPLRPDHS